MTQEPIIINLDDIANPNIDSRHENFIQVDARDKLRAALDRGLARAEETHKKPASERPPELNVLHNRHHDTILVSARRGQGKTTFLSAILKEYEDQPGNFYSLGIIDPTLIETKQNIVVAVINRIRIAVEHQHKRLGHEHSYNEFKASLHELARGLSMLDGVGDTQYHNNDWLDPDYVLEKGLKDASAAYDFERRFRNFVSKAKDCVKCKVFVLAIDDVDTWFERGWPVLEAIRKYFNTPHLRIILSGDLNLYSLLVRRQQWMQMGDTFLKGENAVDSVDRERNDWIRVSNLGRMVDALEDQYLIKVLPPENRIELRKLGWYAEQRGIKFLWKDHYVKNNEAIIKETSSEGYIKIFANRLMGYYSVADCKRVSSELLEMPTRSALRALSGAKGLYEVPDGDVDQLRRTRRACIDALRSVAWVALTEKGLAPDKTEYADPKPIMVTVADWLTWEHRWRELSRFYPDQVDNDSGNLVAIFMSALLYDIFDRSPGRMFDYWLRIALIRERLDRDEIRDNLRDDPQKNELRKLMDHLRADVIEPGFHFVGRLAAWDSVAHNSGESRTSNYDIRLSGAPIPLDRIRQTSATSKALYGLNSRRDNHPYLNRDYFKELIENKNGEHREQLLVQLPAALRDYHEKWINAEWDKPSEEQIEKNFTPYFANSIVSVINRLDSDAQLVARLPINRIVNRQESEGGNYSFLRLLSIIGELTDLLNSSNQNRHDAILNVLRDGGQNLSYRTPAPNGANQQTTSTSEMVVENRGEDDIDENTGENDIQEETGNDPVNKQNVKTDIAGHIDAWLKYFSEDVRRSISVSPVTLARIWARFTYAHNRMLKELNHGDSRYLGILFHRSIIIFLHSVGYEALRASDTAIRRSIANNPTRSSINFRRLIDEIYNKADEKFRTTQEFKFFDFLFSCPIWNYFWDFKTNHEEDSVEKNNLEIIFKKYKEKTKLFLNEENKNVIFDIAKNNIEFESLCSILNTVPMQGNYKEDLLLGLRIFSVTNPGQVSRPTQTPKKTGRPKTPRIISKKTIV